LQTHSGNTISVESGLSRNRLVAALLSFCAILFCFWFAGRHFSIEQRIGGHLPSTFAAFALLLTLVHAAQTRYFSDGDCQAASLELADMFTGLADKIDAQSRRH